MLVERTVGLDPHTTEAREVVVERARSHQDPARDEQPGQRRERERHPTDETFVHSFSPVCAARCAAIAVHPSRALEYAGAHPVASLNLLFATRCDAVRALAPEPPSARTTPLGMIRRRGRSNAAANASVYSRRRSGSSSTTL